MPIDDILATGKWRSPDVFFKYYCRPIEHLEPPTMFFQLQRQEHLKACTKAIMKKYSDIKINGPARTATIKRKISASIKKPMPLTTTNLAKFNQQNDDQISMTLADSDAPPEDPPDSFMDNLTTDLPPVIRNVPYVKNLHPEQQTFYKTTTQKRQEKNSRA